MAERPAPGPAVASPFDAEGNYNNGERELSTLDSGWANCALALRTGHRFGHGPRELRTQSLQSIWAQLEVRRKRFQRGDTLELLHAIELCAEENLPLPTWLAVAYRLAFVAFLQPSGKVSLDRIFYSEALPTNTPKKAAAARQDWALGFQIYDAVWQVAARHTALDGALDDVLDANDWGVAKTKARELVEMVEKTHCALTGNQTLSQFWEKRRKSMHDG